MLHAQSRPLLVPIGSSMTSPQPWWTDRIGYQVYVPSFADSNGDGWGDLPGLIDRLDYIADLGIDVLWLSPIHPSPFADHGYDVADYRGVHPRYGTLDDVDRLIAAARQRDMRVLLDLVPNHSSSEHEWFRQARSSRDNPYRDYYIWRDPAPDGGPPNNWVSAFGGPAWTRDEVSGQYYLHLFTPGQPDLNWDNPRIAEEFDEILRFWFDRGVAGFRIDVAHSMAKAEGLPDLPVVPPEEREDSGEFASFEHRYDFNQPGVFDIHRRWRTVAEPYDALLLGEVYLLDPLEIAHYVKEQDGLHLSFWFGLVEASWDPDRFETLLRIADVTGPHIAWVQSSHDSSRAVSRYGDGAVGRRRALAIATLTIGLPALPVLYQGEELGLGNGVIPPDEVQDPGVLQGGSESSRDVARTPMPWSPGPGLGFTTAERAWISFGERTERDCVSVQQDDPASPLSAYRSLLATRRRLPDLRRGDLRWVDAEKPLIGYERGECIVAANVGPGAGTLELPEGTWTVEFSTSGQSGTATGTFALPEEHAAVLRRTGS